MKVPAFMLKKLYVPKSLHNEPGGFAFQIKNTLVPATLLGLPEVAVDGEAVEPKRLQVTMDGEVHTTENTTPDRTATFKKDMVVDVRVNGPTLPPGRHVVHLKVKSKEFDVLEFDVDDTV